METVNSALEKALNAIGIVKDVPFNLYTKNGNALGTNPYVFDGEDICYGEGDYDTDTLYDILYGRLTLKPLENENNTKYVLTSTNNTLKDLPKYTYDTLECARLAVCLYCSYNAGTVNLIKILEVTKVYSCKETKDITVEEIK